MTQSQKGENSNCPSDDRLRLWLEDPGSLSSAEIEHVVGCARCEAILDDCPTGLGMSRDQLTSDEHSTSVFAPFAEGSTGGERSLDGSQRTSTSNTNPARPVTTDTEQTLPAASSDQSHSSEGAERDARLLAWLQSQVPIERFRLQSVLGRGASGLVVLAFDKKLHRDVAIKFLLSGSPDARKRFEREASTLRQLSHPNIIEILSVEHCHRDPAFSSHAFHGIDLGGQFLVMEYVSGGTALSIQRSTRKDFTQVAAWMAGAARGIQAAHDAGLIHRDIKPSNLLLDLDNDCLRVSDFGLAKAEISHETALTATGEIVGTPEFMSPEHISGVSTIAASSEPKLDKLSDIYSFGATLYAVLTGYAPARGSVAAVLRQIVEVDPPSPRLLNPRIPKPLETICIQSMQKLPQDRYQSMRELADDLERYARGERISARPPTLWLKTRRWVRKNPVLAAALSTVAALILVLAVGSSISALILWQQQQALLAEKRQNLFKICDQVVVAEPTALSIVLEQLTPHEQRALPILHQLLDSVDSHRSRINLACALAQFQPGQESYLVRQVAEGELESSHCLPILAALQHHRESALEAIHKEFEDSDDSWGESQCRLAIIAAALDNPHWLLKLASQDANLHSKITHLIPVWYGGVSLALDHLEASDNDLQRFLLSSGIGLVPSPQITAVERERIRAIAEELDFAEWPTAHRQVHWESAFFWMCRKLQVGTAAESNDPFWSTPKSLARDYGGLRMLRVLQGTFVMGREQANFEYQDQEAHEVQITQDFWLSDREVSRRLFAAFVQSTAEHEQVDWEPDLVISPSPRHPAQRVSWDQAARFCNWLSHLHGFSPCYIEDPESGPLEIPLGEDATWTGTNWRFIKEADGYRLPTEAEFEYACRAGTKSVYSFGDDVDYLTDYAAWSNNTRVPAAPCGSLLPNPWGFFDLHGNVWEWTQDWYRQLDSEPAVDPMGDQISQAGRIFKGGGVFTYTGYPTSCSRGAALPDVRYDNVGFRLARNVSQ